MAPPTTALLPGATDAAGTRPISFLTIKSILKSVMFFPGHSVEVRIEMHGYILVSFLVLPPISVESSGID